MQHLKCLCPVTKVFLLALEARDTTATNVNFKIHVSVHADTYGIKIQTWKKRKFNLHFSSFSEGCFKKEKMSFVSFFFSVNSSFTFQSGNWEGRCQLFKIKVLVGFFWGVLGQNFAYNDKQQTLGETCAWGRLASYHEHLSKILWQMYLGWNKHCKFYFDKMASLYDSCFLRKSIVKCIISCFIASRPSSNPQIKHLEQARPGKALCSSDHCHTEKGQSWRLLVQTNMLKSENSVILNTDMA